MDARRAGAATPRCAWDFDAAGCVALAADLAADMDRWGLGNAPANSPRMHPRYDRAMIPLADAQARARQIKVLLFDVDGVLTDGSITVHPNDDGSATEVKSFSAHDGLGISLARLGGLRTGVITKRQSQTVAIRARDLKLEFVYQGQAYKTHAAEEIAAKAGVAMDEIAYVGDDIVDLPVMRICGLAIAVANARPQVLAEAHWVTSHVGGAGAGRDAIDFILEAQGSLKRVIEQYLDESNTEARKSDIGTGNM
jgi:3-deoxy-D-manno-octulosonate 8-phosphate phosphatase (KDO 8-P phosphatase)